MQGRILLLVGMWKQSLFLLWDLDEPVDDDLEAGPHLLAAGDDLVLRQNESVPNKQYPHYNEIL